MIQITDRIFLGTTTEALDAGLMKGRFLSFQSILSCTTVMPPAVSLPGVLYGHVNVPHDMPWRENEKTYVADFIAAGVGRGNVFIHSDMGTSRCVAALMFYLMAKKEQDKERVLSWIKYRHPGARVDTIVFSEAASPVKINLKEVKSVSDEVMVKQSKVEDGLDVFVSEHEYFFSFSDGFSGNVFISKLPEEDECMHLPAVDLLEAIVYMLTMERED